MKTRKAKEAPQEEIFTPPPDGKADTVESNGNKPQATTIAFKLKPDGSVDLESMREATKERLRQALRSTPSLNPQDSKTLEVVIFHPAMVSGMYDMLGAIEAAAAQKYGKIPPAIAKQVFTYTVQEKEILSGPTIRVLNKYAADWMIKYQDEIALATLLISLTVAKVNAAITLSRMGQAQTVPQAQKEGDEPKPQPN